jgi:hypothetical protein
VPTVREADDMIVTGATKERLAQDVTPLMAHFLAPRGLPLSPGHSSAEDDEPGGHSGRGRRGSVQLGPRN